MNDNDGSATASSFGRPGASRVLPKVLVGRITLGAGVVVLIVVPPRVTIASA